MARGRTSVELLCESCGKALDTWVYDPRVGESRGGDRGLPADESVSDDGKAAFVRYRCRGCKREVVLVCREIASAHYAAVGAGRRSLQVGIDLEGLPPGDRYAFVRDESADSPQDTGQRR